MDRRCCSIITVFVCTLVVGIATTDVLAEPTTAFRYQGQLKHGSVPLSATCDMMFALWNDPNETDAAAGRVGEPILFNDDLLTGDPVEVAGGLFAVELDFGGDVFGAEDLWLEVQIDCVRGDDTSMIALSPRQQITASPYSANSLSTRGIDVDAEGQVGIGTSAPSSILHLRNDGPDIGLRMKTNRSWTAELRQTESSFLSLINGGSERLTIKYNGNVGVGVLDPSARLDVAGSVKTTGEVIIPSTTRYLMLSAADMVPRVSSMEVYRSFGDVVSFFTPPGQETTLYAPIHLPSGAEITELRAFLSDNAPDHDVAVWIEKYNRGGGVLTLAIIYTGGTPGLAEYVDNTIESPIIDNSENAYYLVVSFTVPPDDGETHFRVRPVRIAYTVDRLLP